MLPLLVALTISLGPNCHAVNDRYVACFQFRDETLVRVRVRPVDTSSQPLSNAEYLDLLAKLQKVRSFGNPVSIGPFDFGFVSECLVVLEEQYEDAVIDKHCVDMERPLFFNVDYFEHVTGRVDAAGETGPNMISIGGMRYTLSPKDRRMYRALEEVDVRAAREWNENDQ